MQDSTKYHFYVKSLSLVVRSKLEYELKARDIKEVNLMDIRHLDLSYNADHGGNHFRIVLRCRLYYKSGSKLEMISFKHRLGQMLCKKDSYEVISQTVGPLMNDGLREILLTDGKTPRPITIFSTSEKDDVKYMIGIGNYVANGEYNILTTIPSHRVKLAITGDLAWYATMLGKPGMDSKWCAFCDLPCSQWSTVAQIKGCLWSRDSLKAQLNIVSNNINNKMEAREKKGVKFKPILDICPSIFIMPPLHIKLGIVNRVFIKQEGYSYISWSQRRIENIPTAEKIAWNMLQSSKKDIEKRKEDLQLFKLTSGDWIASLKDELKAVKSELKKAGLDDLAKTNLTTSSERLSLELNQIKEDQKAIEND